MSFGLMSFGILSVYKFWCENCKALKPYKPVSWVSDPDPNVITKYVWVCSHLLPSCLEISALWISGFTSTIFFLSMWEKTMKAFIGRLMWFGECFFVCKKNIGILFCFNSVRVTSTVTCQYCLSFCRFSTVTFTWHPALKVWRIYRLILAYFE